MSLQKGKNLRRKADPVILYPIRQRAFFILPRTKSMVSNISVDAGADLWQISYCYIKLLINGQRTLVHIFDLIDS